MNMKKVRIYTFRPISGLRKWELAHPMMRMRVSLTPFSRKANPTKSYLIQVCENQL